MIHHATRREPSVYTYDLHDAESFSEGVVAAVSAVTGSDPVPDGSTRSETNRTLEPLYTALDPDALDSLFRPTDSGDKRPAGRVTFTYQGYEVTVHGVGHITVEGPESRADETTH